MEIYASLVTEGERANAWWGQGVYTVSKAPHDWLELGELLDNNFRNMLKRDSDVMGLKRAEEEYLRRVAYCIPILAYGSSVVDVSKRCTPEMEQKGKPPGTNLADKKLNEPGKRSLLEAVRGLKARDMCFLEAFSRRKWVIQGVLEAFRGCRSRECIVVRVEREEEIRSAEASLVETLRQRAFAVGSRYGHKNMNTWQAISRRIWLHMLMKVHWKSVGNQGEFRGIEGEMKGKWRVSKLSQVGQRLKGARLLRRGPAPTP